MVSCTRKLLNILQFSDSPESMYPSPRRVRIKRAQMFYRFLS